MYAAERRSMTREKGEPPSRFRGSTPITASASCSRSMAVQLGTPNSGAACGSSSSCESWDISKRDRAARHRDHRKGVLKCRKSCMRWSSSKELRLTSLPATPPRRSVVQQYKGPFFLLRV